MTGRPDDLGLMTGSFALDAVDDQERAAMDAALLESAELRQEVDSLRQTALLLAYAAEPVEPPKDLKATLMAKIAATPQLPPLAQDDGLEARPEPASSVAPVVGAAPVGSAESTARRRWFQRPGALLAAAAAVVIVAGGGFLGGNLVNGSSQQTGQSQASSSQLEKIYAAADFQRTSTPVTGGGTATVVWSDSLAKSAVILKDVAAQPSGKTYELWYIGSKAVPAGTFNTATNGVTTTVLTGTKSKNDTVGLTVEPAGGSKQPTTKPIMAVPTTTAQSSSAERASSSDPPQAAGAPTILTSTASPAPPGGTSATSSDVASGVSGSASPAPSASPSGAAATVSTPIVGASVSAGQSGVGVSASTPVGVGAGASVGSSGVGATVTTPLDTGVDASVSGSGTSVGVQTPLGNVGVQLPGLGDLLGQ